MERLADLSTCEYAELAVAIYEYKDVFSSNPVDMGQTDLATHSIDGRGGAQSHTSTTQTTSHS